MGFRLARSMTSSSVPTYTVYVLSAFTGRQLCYKHKHGHGQEMYLGPIQNVHAFTILYNVVQIKKEKKTCNLHTMWIAMKSTSTNFRTWARVGSHTHSCTLTLVVGELNKTKLHIPSDQNHTGTELSNDEVHVKINVLDKPIWGSISLNMSNDAKHTHTGSVVSLPINGLGHG